MNRSSSYGRTSGSKSKMVVKSHNRQGSPTKEPSSPSLMSSHSKSSVNRSTMPIKLEKSHETRKHKLTLYTMDGGYYCKSVEAWLNLEGVGFDHFFVPICLKFGYLACELGVDLAEDEGFAEEKKEFTVKEMHKCLLARAFKLTKNLLIFSVLVVNYVLAPPLKEVDLDFIEKAKEICLSLKEVVILMLKSKTVLEIHNNTAQQLLTDLKARSTKFSDTKAMDYSEKMADRDINTMCINMLLSVMNELQLLESLNSNIIYSLAAADGISNNLCLETFSGCSFLLDSLHNIIRKSVSLRSIIQRTSFNPQLPPSNTHQSLQLDENLQNAIWNAKPIDIKDGSKSGSLYDVIFSITHPEYEGSELDMYKVIVATFPTIKLNPMDLLQLLLARLKPLDSLKQTELAKKVQLKTLSILRWWIKTNPNDLSLEVSSEITQYTKYVDTEAVIFIETIDKMLQKGARMQCIDPAHLPPMNVQVPDRISSCLEVIFGVPDVLVAHQLVVISSQLFIKILPTEFMNLAWSDEGLKHRATNIIAFVERANLLSKWVVTTILTKENAASRAKLIKRFIKIGMILLELRDFNSLMGLVVGISNSSITRLRKSWALIGDKLIENWNFISHLMSPEKGFTHYREYVSKINDPLIPLLTVYLSDLILISEGNPTYTDQNSTIINLTKLEQIYKVIVRIQTFQSSTKSLKTMQKMEPLFTLLTNLPSLPDENLYEISLWVEPREMVAKFPPLLYRGQTFSALQAHGFSTEEVGEIIDLVVENHIEDPRWVYVSKNIEKRRQVMKVVFGHTIRWCSKQSCSIFVKHARSKNPNEPKRIVAVSVFLEPYSRIKAPISTLVFEIGRLVVNAGTKVAGRVKQVIKGIEDFVAKYEPEHCWEFFYLCVTPEYINDREYWEDIVWRVLSKADSDKLPVWTYFTDIKRMDMLRSWGFSDVVSGSLIENKIQMWGTGRSPNRWDISEHSNDSLLYRSEDHSFLERSRSNIL